jgi:hypothetical protein
MGFDCRYAKVNISNNLEQIRQSISDIYNYVSDIDNRISDVGNYVSNIYNYIEQKKIASVFNTSVTANTNIFSTDLSPTRSPVLFRIYATFDTAGVLSVVRTRGTVSVVEQLNSGNNLNANCAYIFDIVVEEGETINFQYSANATCLVLKIIETRW